MRKCRRCAVLQAVIVVIFLATMAPFLLAQGKEKGDAVAGHRAPGDGKVRRINLSELFPLVFLENKGPLSDYPFLCGRLDANLLFGDAGPVFEMLLWGESDSMELDFAVSLDGTTPSNPLPRARAGTFNYYRGNDPAAWYEGVKAYKRICYEGIYAGIDLTVKGGKAGCVYEFRLAPGVTPEPVEITCEGAALEIDELGFLHIYGEWEEYVEEPPVVWQKTRHGARQFLAAFRMIDDDTYGFETPEGLNPALETVVEHHPAWGGHFTAWFDQGYTSVTEARGGGVVIAGSAHRWEIPCLTDSYALRYNDLEVFAAKVGTNGALAWCTVLNGQLDTWDGPSGEANDYCKAAATARDGSIWLTGETHSEDFPMMNAFQNERGGPTNSGDAFVSKVDCSGRLLFSSFLGGSGHDVGYDIAADSQGSAWIAGLADSPDFPTPNSDGPHVPYTNREVFVAKVTAAGEHEWGYCFGGSDSESARAVAVDSPGTVWVAGTTYSSDFPVPGGFDTQLGGSSDAFVARLVQADGLVWATYLGGAGTEAGWDVVLDSSSNAWVVGRTKSVDFPVVGGFDQELGGTSSDGYIARISPDGTLEWATYLGGGDYDEVLAADMDKNDSLYVTGTTYSSDFPSQRNTGPSEDTDSFVTKVDASGRLRWSTFFLAGGEPGGEHWPSGIEADGGKIYVACGYK